MIVVVADTSGLLAALDETHPDGDRARQVLDDAGALIASPVLLSELDHVGNRVLGRQAAHQVIDDIRYRVRQGRAVLPEITVEVLDTAQAVRDCYSNLDLDLADAVNVALAERFRTNAVLTLDRRDFRAVRPLTHHESFQVLPDDV